ncbi:protease complex subunit PrcB family protein [Deinococcus sp. HMF7604]|uniref:protease complex subunit PrcB family protein n=1 Tax=Deinococcus betulae TaxID=2873312 RepID=UPI001CCAEBD5|nr:protease complex subunit PrcB family protein [Deinococcus betulae]MBZ9749455.1 protease complex subunit PrcB family protein [Deinococcus betulae]
MKTKVVPFLLLTAGLSACTMSGPSNLRVHEALLYGGTQERVVWVYGAPQGGAQTSVKLGGVAADLRAQASGGLALPGTLSVNGQATYRLPTTVTAQKLSVTRAPSGLFSVTPQPGASLSAVYYTDGRTWLKLSGVQGTVSGTPVEGLMGAGSLTPEEARALGSELLGQGNLAVAVLSSTSLPDAPLTVEPAPSEYLRTGLYILPNVAVTALPTGGTPSTPTPTTPGGTRVTFTELTSGTQARVTTAGAQVASGAAAVASLYAQAGLSSVPAAVTSALSGNTVVGVFLGQRATGGYSVRVTGVSANNGTLTVTVRVGAPAEGSLTTQVITSPYTIIRVPGTYARVTLVDERGQPLTTGTGNDR